MSSKPKKNRTKQYLMLLTVAGLIAIVGGSSSGTFASFTAETTNAGNYFATGTLLLHDNGGLTTCKSEADPSNLNANNLSTNGCDVLFNLKPLISSSGVQYAHLTLTNAGTIDSANISFDAPTGCLNSTVVHGSLSSLQTLSAPVTSPIAVSSLVGDIASGDQITIDDGAGDTQTFTTTGAVSASTTATSIPVDLTGSPTWNFAYPANSTVNVGQTFGTAANLCDMQVVIAETDSTFNGHVDAITDAGTNFFACSFGVAVAGPNKGCQFDATKKLDTLPNNVLTNLTLGSAKSGNVGSGLDAGKSRYFIIAVKPPASLDNTYQNRSASFDLRWHLEA